LDTGVSAIGCGATAFAMIASISSGHGLCARELINATISAAAVEMVWERSTMAAASQLTAAGARDDIAELAIGRHRSAAEHHQQSGGCFPNRQFLTRCWLVWQTKRDYR